jgi:hypothetical protein
MRFLNKTLSLICLTGTLLILSAFALNMYPKFEWKVTTHDFGEIKIKKPVSFEFEFTNKGEGFLVISKVEASCGCTVTEYTKNPVPPNGTGRVKAIYDAANPGVFRKSLTVTANIEGGPEYLYITGTVLE